jgi:hypothetical protein
MRTTGLLRVWCIGLVALSVPVLSSAAVLERTAPTAQTYVQGTDFAVMTFSGSGDVTANVQEVNDNQFPPGPVASSSNAGCEDADFAGFVPGRIALIQRGTCFFSLKVLNAQNAGAVGVLIFNEGQPGRTDAIGGTGDGTGITIPVLGTSFAVGEQIHNLLAGGPVTVHIVVGPTIQSFSPAKIWLGLKNSDAVGLRVDLLVELLVNDVPIGNGFLENQTTGSSGFNNAQLKAVALAGGAGEFTAGDELAVRVSVRRTCSGGGHNSGTVRLWYNGQPIDSGATRDAGSRFGVTTGGSSTDHFLRNGFALSTTAGSSRLSADAAVNSKVACNVEFPNFPPDRPYTEIGTWSVTLP